MCQTIFQVFDLEARHHLCNAFFDRRAWQLQIFQAESEVFVHDRVDDLVVWILEHEPHLSTQVLELGRPF